MAKKRAAKTKAVLNHATGQDARVAKKSTSKKRTTKEKTATSTATQGDAVADPSKFQDDLDPGDETARRYRYQHAYGAILLVGAATNRLPYESIWCEQQDDFLASFNGIYDSYQVKTTFPERGPWDLTKDGLIGAMTKFAELEMRFPGKINKFKFVSNARVLKTTDKKKIHKSPICFLKAIEEVSSHKELREPFSEALAALATKCKAEEECLFNVLKRVELITGPSIDDFEAALSVDHLPKVSECQGLTVSQINAIRDELIQQVADASSKRVTDPAKHWYCVNGGASHDPWLQAKQISISVVTEIAKKANLVPFRFSPASTMLMERVQTGDLSTFEKKMIRGGLASQLETMRRRTVSTERHLLELANKKPDEISDIQNQLECYVQGICDDAKLKTSKNREMFGEDMLREVQQRLRETADGNPGMVHSQPYECLIGVAGLLTEECTVWWGPQFDLEEQS